MWKKFLTVQSDILFLNVTALVDQGRRFPKSQTTEIMQQQNSRLIRPICSEVMLLLALTSFCFHPLFLIGVMPVYIGDKNSMFYSF
jgi:hypothetical protein